ncbi:MAG: MFS transporter [Vicinamibacteria bacterium]|nr:MFS transporter [Vicinamibacteria bacterium]
MPNGSHKLSLKEKIGYSTGDAASNIFFQTFVLFSTIFYTDVFGLPAASVGAMFLITKIWDAVNDPIMGMIADRTETRWGKFRPYLIWFALPFGLFGVLMFTTPDLSVTGKLIYAYITYTLALMTYTVINVPYSALMGVITPNSHERTILSSFRFMGAFAAQLLIQFSVLKLVDVFGKDDRAAGWQMAMIILSLLAVILLFVAFSTTKERVHPPKGQKTSFGRDLIDLFGNAPWLLVGGATIFQLIWYAMRNGAVIYYFTYFVKDQDVSLFGKGYACTYQGMVSAFLMAGTVATIIGVVLTSRISRIFGKGATYAGALGIIGVSTGMFFVLKPENVVTMFVLQIVISFAVGPMSVLQWAIYTDTADYSEWKRGRRATALVMSASLFALKLGIAVGASAMAWILGAYGYRPNQEQSEAGLLGIRMVMSVYPAIFALIGAAIMIWYPLGKPMMQRIETELIARRQA